MEVNNSKFESIKDHATTVGNAAAKSASAITQAAVHTAKSVSHVGLRSVTEVSNFAGYAALCVGTTASVVLTIDTCGFALQKSSPFRPTYLGNLNILDRHRPSSKQLSPEASFNQQLSDQIALTAILMIVAPFAAKACFAVGNLAQRIDRSF